MVLKIGGHPSILCCLFENAHGPGQQEKADQTDCGGEGRSLCGGSEHGLGASEGAPELQPRGG